MRFRLQHWFNELHLYCRFKSCGFSGEKAKRWSKAIGSWLKPFIYRKEN